MTADATGCSHDNYGDDQFWTDQYWMGWDYYDSSPYCDTSGTYLYAVQRINLVVVSFPSSGVDGIYGSGTQSDVRKFQFLQSITDDGLVGTTTWGRYDNYLSAATCYPTGECLWKIPVYSSAWIFRDFGACCNWETQKPGLAGWTAFGRYGPP
jgi:hypothetical protein